jgi:micrococcal nuclease
MSKRWDEEWAASMPQRTRPRRKAGIGAVFGIVAALMGISVVSTRWRQWSAPTPAGVTASDLKPSAQDRESAPFALCKGHARVTCVVDGDTIWYKHEKIRIADINAPEISHPQCDYEEQLGDKARDRLMGLLNAGPFSVVADGSRDVDKYGRKLRDITRGGKSLGSVLVSEGLAERWTGHRRDWCH